MRIGLLGPAEGDSALVRKAAEFALDKLAAEQVVYLGADDAARDAARNWAGELSHGAPGEDAFLERAFKLSLGGSASELEELLRRDCAARRLSALRSLPPAPTRAVEMFEDKIVLFVHDKAQLDAEDIANAYLVVYGRSKSVALNHFGPRTFFAPGPLRTGQLAYLERHGDSGVAVVQVDLNSGDVVGRTALSAGRSKMVVLS
ncbi:MAG TPA: hypothetical protein VFZ61_27560 [Polyangiales bacterium]